MISYDLTNEQYHGETTAVSSSQLKKMLEDPELFYKKYILKEGEKEESSAFDVGTYFHTAILEPHKLKDDCVVYTGIRRGKEWEAFKLSSVGETSITSAELETANVLIKAIKDSPVAMEIIGRGQSEVSCFADIIVKDGDIFGVDENRQFNILKKGGWELHEAIAGGTNLRVKVRADLLASNEVLDLKSTTGNCRDRFTMASNISRYSYDLSAALYLDIFELITKKKRDFVWAFASKDLGNSKCWYASAKNVLVGRAKWSKAVKDLARCIEKEWHFEDEAGVLEPQVYEEQWIKQQEDIL